MMARLSYVLKLTAAGVVVGGLYGAILSALLSIFFGWMWWPVISLAVIIGLINAVQSSATAFYRYW